MVFRHCLNAVLYMLRLLELSYFRRAVIIIFFETNNKM